MYSRRSAGLTIAAAQELALTIPESLSRSTGAPFGKPSLMDGPRNAVASGGAESTQPLRMLDALGDASQGRRKDVTSFTRMGLLALSAVMLAVAAFSWSQQRDESTVVLGNDPLALARPAMATSQTASVMAHAQVHASSEAQTSVVAAAPAAGPASIERSADPSPSQGPSRPESRATRPVAGPLRQLASSSALGEEPSAKTATSTAPRTKPAAADDRRRNSEAGRAQERKVVTARAAPRSATSSRQGASSSSPDAARDPDVTLLSAMLARLSSDQPGDVATTARLVERCDARYGKESSDAAECRRQICTGHWGQTDACPRALAPKRN